MTQLEIWHHKFTPKRRAWGETLQLSNSLLSALRQNIKAVVRRDLDHLGVPCFWLFAGGLFIGSRALFSCACLMIWAKTVSPPVPYPSRKPRRNAVREC